MSSTKPEGPPIVPDPTGPDVPLGTPKPDPEPNPDKETDDQLESLPDDDESCDDTD